MAINAQRLGVFRVYLDCAQGETLSSSHRLIWSPGVSQRSHEDVDVSLLAIYPACNNEFKTCKVIVVLRFI